MKGWGLLPEGRVWGSSAGVDIGPDGHIWTYDRCGATALTGGCDTSAVNPILKLDRTTGQVLTSFGAGLFVLPHGIHVDRDGNVWVTDSQGNKAGTKGFDEAWTRGCHRKRSRHVQRALRRDHRAER
jgi:streptogramin lyase